MINQTSRYESSKLFVERLNEIRIFSKINHNRNRCYDFIEKFELCVVFVNLKSAFKWNDNSAFEQRIERFFRELDDVSGGWQNDFAAAKRNRER